MKNTKYFTDAQGLETLEDYLQETGEWHSIDRVSFEITTAHDMYLICCAAEWSSLDIGDLVYGV